MDVARRCAELGSRLYASAQFAEPARLVVVRVPALSAGHTEELRGALGADALSVATDGEGARVVLPRDSRRYRGREGAAKFVHGHLSALGIDAPCIVDIGLCASPLVVHEPNAGQHGGASLAGGEPACLVARRGTLIPESEGGSGGWSVRGLWGSQQEGLLAGSYLCVLLLGLGLARQVTSPAHGSFVAVAVLATASVLALAALAVKSCWSRRWHRSFGDFACSAVAAGFYLMCESLAREQQSRAAFNRFLIMVVGMIAYLLVYALAMHKLRPLMRASWRHGIGLGALVPPLLYLLQLPKVAFLDALGAGPLRVTVSGGYLAVHLYRSIFETGALLVIAAVLIVLLRRQPDATFITDAMAVLLVLLLVISGSLRAVGEARSIGKSIGVGNLTQAEGLAVRACIKATPEDSLAGPLIVVGNGEGRVLVLAEEPGSSVPMLLKDVYAIVPVGKDKRDCRGL